MSLLVASYLTEKLKMEYIELVYKIVEEVIEQYDKENEPKTKEEVVKTTEVPTTITPLQRAIALRRKADNKYDNYIASKLLPGLDK